MAIADSTLTPALLGRTVTLWSTCAGFSFEHTGQVVGVLVALPGTRATSSILLEEGHRCDFFDSDDIDTLLVL